jgi:hypothetical protein
VSLVSITSLRNLSQLCLSLAGWRFHGGLESLVERFHVRQGLRAVEREVQVAEVMHRHAGADDEDVLVPQDRDGLSETVVQVYVLAVILAYLHYRDIEGVLFGMEG